MIRNFEDEGKTRDETPILSLKFFRLRLGFKKIQTTVSIPVNTSINYFKSKS